MCFLIVPAHPDQENWLDTYPTAAVVELTPRYLERIFRRMDDVAALAQGEMSFYKAQYFDSWPCWAETVGLAVSADGFEDHGVVIVAEEPKIDRGGLRMEVCTMNIGRDSVTWTAAVKHSDQYFTTEEVDRQHLQVPYGRGWLSGTRTSSLSDPRQHRRQHERSRES